MRHHQFQDESPIECVLDVAEVEFFATQDLLFHLSDAPEMKRICTPEVIASLAALINSDIQNFVRLFGWPRKDFLSFFSASDISTSISNYLFLLPKCVKNLSSVKEQQWLDRVEYKSWTSIPRLHHLLTLICEHIANRTTTQVLLASTGLFQYLTPVERASQVSRSRDLED